MKSKDILRDLIESIICGELELDSKFPSEAQLSETYGCNRHTIRKVMDTLIERGYLRKTHGGPAYVNAIPSTHSLNLSSLYDLHSAGDIHTKVLSFKQIVADEDLCERLKITRNSKVWAITRLRCIGDTIKHIEYIYMACNLFPDLTQKHCEASLLSYIEFEQNYEISHGVKTISAVNLTDYELDLSKRDPGSLAIEIENVGFLTNGRVYEYSRNRHFDNSMVFHAKR